VSVIKITCMVSHRLFCYFVLFVSLVLGSISSSRVSLCAVVCFRAVRVLLKFGADPNLPDEFSNVYLVAREKGLNSLRGTASSFHTAPSLIQYSKCCMLECLQ